MKAYKPLKQQIFGSEEYAIVPLRYEDRLKIMEWRNAQIYHLRQTKPLTKEDQEYYFDNVVEKLFEQDQPNQILFSYLENGKCIGYGGLVHINWIDKNAELSFIIDPTLAVGFFKKHWLIYLLLIEKVAFEELSLHKIYTYAFDLRPYLYPLLEKAGYNKEAILKEHYFFEGKFIDVVIHYKKTEFVSINNHNYRFLNFVTLDENLKKTILSWRNHKAIRRWMYNKNEITLNDHLSFINLLGNREDKLYYLVERNTEYIGVFSLIDFDGKNGEWGYYLAPEFHGRNLGVEFYYASIQFCFERLNMDNLIGYALVSNKQANSLNFLFGFEGEIIYKDGYQDPFYKVLLTKDTWFNKVKKNTRIQKLLALTKRK